MDIGGFLFHGIVFEYWMRGHTEDMNYNRLTRIVYNRYP